MAKKIKKTKIKKSPVNDILKVFFDLEKKDKIG